MSKAGHTVENAVKFIERFPPYARTQIELVQSAAAKNAWMPSSGGVDRTQRKTVRSLAHTMKGAASMIGAHRFAAASRALQDACEALGVGGMHDTPGSVEHDKVCSAFEVWKIELACLLKVLQTDAGQLVTNPAPETSPWPTPATKEEPATAGTSSSSS